MTIVRIAMSMESAKTREAFNCASFACIILGRILAFVNHNSELNQNTPSLRFRRARYFDCRCNGQLRNGIVMKLRNLFNRYKSETDGNISIMFGVSFVATLTLIGAVFDLMILNKNKQHVQYLTDAAALAALQFNGTIAEREAVFADHVQTLNRLSRGEDLEFRSSIDIVEVDGALQLTAQLTVPHDLVLLQHLGGPESISLSTICLLYTSDAADE